LPTLNLSTVWDITSAIKPPRACFLDFPIGCPAGKPAEPDLQRDVLKAALTQAPKFSNDWSIYEMPFQWSEDGNRDWEEELKEIYRQGRRTVEAHVTDHATRGESLAGKEKEFAIRCNC
jgi:D-proline reductase (dithiol) PrdB